MSARSIAPFQFTSAPIARAGLLRRILARGAQLIALWRQRAADRAELAQMSYRDLRDIRLNPADARDQARTPFWRG